MKHITLAIHGHLPRKSNSRRIVVNRRTGKPMVIKSPEALAYERDFMRQVPGSAKIGMKGQLHLTAVIYYRSNRSDLSDELLCDSIEKAGIIKNDRQFVSKILYKRIDKENPRVVFTVSSIEEKEKGE